MNKDKIIVIDVDNTLFDIGTECVGKDWLSYLLDLCTEEEKYIALCRYEEDNICDCVEYDLSLYFDNISREKAFEYWYQKDLYDNLNPRLDIVAAIKELQEDFTVIFVSFMNDGHSKSKHNMLKRNFGDDTLIVDTKCKGLIPADVVIDDRNYFLNLFDDCLKIKINTKYTQDEDLLISRYDEPIYELAGWLTIKIFIKECFKQ